MYAIRSYYDDADHAVELVDVAVAGDAKIVLVDALTPDQGRLSGIALLGVDAVDGELGIGSYNFV